MSMRNVSMVAVVLILFVASSCSDPADPELAGFCERLVTTVQLNEKATQSDADRSPEELAEQMEEAALASDAFLSGPGPADIRDEMTVVNEYESGEPGIIFGEEYFSAYFAVLAYADTHCEGVVISQDGTVLFNPTG